MSGCESVTAEKMDDETLLRRLSLHKCGTPVIPPCVLQPLGQSLHGSHANQFLFLTKQRTLCTQDACGSDSDGEGQDNEEGDLPINLQDLCFLFLFLFFWFFLFFCIFLLFFCKR